MRSMTVKLQLLLLIGVITLNLLFVGGTGYNSTAKQGDTLFDMDIKLSGLRNELEAEMMLDAIRGDVMQALYMAQTGDSTAQEPILASFADHADDFRSKIQDSLDLGISDDIDGSLATLQPTMESYITQGEAIINASFSDFASAQSQLEAFLATFSQLEEEMGAFADLIESAASDASIAATEVSESSLQLMVWIIIACVAVCLVGAWLVLRGILKPLNRLNAAINAIRSNTNGKLERVRGFTGEFRNIESSFNGVLDGLEAKRAEENVRAEAAFRVQQALNSATTNVVLTDASMQVIYVNEAARVLFQKAEGNIRKSLPSFAASRIVGGALDQFFPDARMARDIQNTSAPRRDELKLGDNTYNVISTAVLDESGQRLGVVCEWNDLTEQREAERQIESVLQNAINGRLDSRLDAARFQGFMRVLSDSVNTMLDAITVPLRSAASHLQAIAEGHIPDPITTEFKGDFNEIRNNLNTCSKVLKALIQDTTVLVESASRGKLDERVDVSSHWGDYRAIVEGMNNTLDAFAKPVSEVKTVITGFASGDLTKRMNGKYNGDFAVLSDAVNTSVSNLVEMVGKINITSGNLNGSASEISTGNQNLNDRTQEQAAALEETTSTLAGLTSKAEENTANASNANELAQSATAEARKGGEIVSNAVKAMSEIDAASKKIADIISVIDGIAFQTNLLALNASVEAARAGDQGKGFAVVANEVRALAGRSATAAQEIKLLINDTVDKVNHGTKLVNDSGLTLRDIVDSISKVGVIISEISAATSDQMSGFLEVSKAINQLDDMTQQNAAMVEEAAAASESMAEQSDTLRNLMNFFKTDGQAKFESNTSLGKAPAPAKKAPAPAASKPAPAQSKPAPAAKAPKAPLKMVAASSSSKAHDDGHWDEF